MNDAEDMILRNQIMIMRALKKLLSGASGVQAELDGQIAETVEFLDEADNV